MPSSSNPSDALTVFLSDPKAWEATTHSLQRIARAILGDEAAAEDIVQGVWVEALQRPGQSLQQDPLQRSGLSWLKRVVRHRSIDALRRKSREQYRDQQSTRMSALSKSAAKEQDVDDRLEVQREVFGAVEALKEPYRTTIYLRYFEGMAPPAIGQRLNVPVKTIKTRITQAHKQLRMRLGAQYKDDRGRWAPALIGFSGSTTPKTTTALSLSTTLLSMKKLLVLGAALLVAWLGYQLMGSQVAPSHDDPSLTGVANSDSIAPVRKPAVLDPSQIQNRSLAAAESDRPASTLDTPPTGRLRVTVLDPAGAPSASVHVFALVPHELQYLRKRYRGLTNPEGVVEFLHLPFKEIHLRTDRHLYGKYTKLDLKADGWTEATLQLAPGLRIVGQVHDRTGSAIPNAKVWLSARANGWTGGAFVAKTDERGFYEVLNVPPGQSVGAMALGFRPSRLVDLDQIDCTTEPIEINLALPNGGAQLSGSITNPSGAPIANALVTLGGADEYDELREDENSWREVWKPLAVFTDSDGHYSFEGVLPGTHPLQAKARGRALWSENISLKPHTDTTQDIVLVPGATVKGLLSESGGSPVADAKIFAFFEPQSKTRLHEGHPSMSGAQRVPATLSDAKGQFELQHVSPGTLHLYAFEPPADATVFNSNVRYAYEQVHLADGQTHIWNPVLDAGLVVEGVVRYQDGVPFQDAFVVLEGIEGQRRAMQTHNGAFRFMQLDNTTYSGLAQTFGLPKGTPMPRLDGIVPGGPPIEFVIEADSPAKQEPAFATIRFVDSGKRATGKVKVHLNGVDSWSPTNGQEIDGVWKFKIPTPGRYRAIAQQGEQYLAFGAPFDVLAGDRLDLPDLISTPGGSVHFNIQSSPEHPPTEIRAFLEVDSGSPAEALDFEGVHELRVDQVEPGKAMLRVMGPNIRELDVHFDINPGKTTQVNVPLKPAVAVPYQVKWSQDQNAGSLAITFIDRNTSAVVDHFDFPDISTLSSPFKLSAYLELGSYTFQVIKPGTPRYSEDFEITSFDPEDSPHLGLRK